MTAHAPALDLRRLEQHWADLHHADTEPWPQNAQAQQAWLSLHRGQFAQAVELGLAAGLDGLNVANQAQATLALHGRLPPPQRAALWQSVADRAGGQLLLLGSAAAALARAHFWRGHALAQRCQDLHVVKALALGLSLQARTHLELAVAMAPSHIDAHLALAAFHADIIDKVGPLIAQLSYGVSASAALGLIERAAALAPRSARALVEQARTLELLQGAKARARARAWYAQAAGLQPLDAAEQLDIGRAREALST